MEQENKQMNSLPDNAYRELAPGEEYKPMMPANAKPKEVTPYSVTFGIIMAVIFSAAAAYLGLKVGKYSRLQFLSLLLLLVWAICWERKICWDKT